MSKKSKWTPKSGKIYIMPTKIGVIYGVGTLGLLLAASAFNNNLTYTLFFLLSVLGVLVMHQTHENLKSIQVSKVESSPIEAGAKGLLKVYLKNTSKDPKHSISITTGKNPESICSHIHPMGLSRSSTRLETHQRGVFDVGRVKLSTIFPLGLFYAWTYYKTEEKYYVYPKPIGNAPVETVSLSQEESHVFQQTKSGEDFSEHRKFQSTDNYKHMDWKAFARNRGKLVKQFDSGAGDIYRLEYASTPGGTIEDRLSQLSQWVIDLSQKEKPYSLVTPEKTVDFALGKKHEMICLKLLAQFGDHSERAS